MNKDRFLSVQGDKLVDATGKIIALRGYNIGGFLNMENFLTGFPTTESQQRAAMQRGMGERRYQIYFDRFIEAFFSDDDAAYLASLGMNHVRLPLNYQHFEDDERPFEMKEEGFHLVDRVVAVCERCGLYVVPDLHAHPGGQNQRWHSDNPSYYAGFWRHPHFQDRSVNIWEKLAARYKGNPAIAGYNIMNEPGERGGKKIAGFYDRVVKAVRAVDPDHIIFLDGNRYAQDFSDFDPASIPANTVYTAHDYKTPGLVYAGPYPGVTRGVYYDRQHIEQTFLRRTEFMRQTGTPIWIGEMGPVFTNRPEADKYKYDLLSDQLAIYNDHGASWCIWAYKDVGNQGLAYTADDSAWVRQIRPVLDKKARLGVDSWCSTDVNIRHIMDPVEQTLAREYPGFDAYPFGTVDWAQQLIRGVLLGEPLLDEYAQCFVGIDSDDAAIALADSFALRNCVRREPMAQIIAART